MHSVGIRILKNKLSQYVRVAAAGEAVLVTDRGQVVAELIAPRTRPDASLAEQRLGALMRQGLLAAARAAPETPLPARKPQTAWTEVRVQLDADRAER